MDTIAYIPLTQGYTTIINAADHHCSAMLMIGALRFSPPPALHQRRPSIISHSRTSSISVRSS